MKEKAALSPWGNYDSHNRSGGWRTERREEKTDRNKAEFRGRGELKGEGKRVERKGKQKDQS